MFLQNKFLLKADFSFAGSMTKNTLNFQVQDLGSDSQGTPSFFHPF